MKFFVLSFVLFCLQVAFAAEYDYGVMIDAGSSGTRIYLYKWVHRAAPATADLGPFSEPITQENWNKKVDIPLSDCAKDLSKIKPMLDTLLGFVHETMEHLNIVDRKSSTPVYLGATAGMRLISLHDREQIMTETRKLLNNSGFYFEYTFAKILSGEEEALFDWIAVNYLHETLTNQRIQQQMAKLSSSPAEKLRALLPTTAVPYDPELRSSARYRSLREQGLVDGFTSVGALDLGGASTQITFAPGQDVMSQYTEYITPARSRHQLYAYSFLGFGQNEASHRLARAILIAAGATDGSTVDFPCFNTGYSAPYTDEAMRVSVTLKGTGDAAVCMEHAIELLNRNAECFGVDRCSVNGVYQPLPPADMEFYLFSGFYYTLSLFGMGDGTYSLQQFEDVRTNALCNLTLDELKQRYPAADVQYLSVSCASLTYIVALLQHGYGFDMTAKQLTVKSAVRGVDVSWALGRIVYEANQLHYEKVLPPADTAFTTIMAVALVVVAVVVAGLGWVLVRGAQTPASIKAYAPM